MAFYAVRKGINPGIYNTWDECQIQVKGFKGAEFKKFNTEQEAIDFINNNTAAPKTPAASDVITPIAPYAFVDGSYNPKTKVFGYGGYLVVSNDPDENDNLNIIEITGSGDQKDLASMRNVAGEIAGSTAAIKKALELGLTVIHIYYDYEGIKKWATGEWKANTPGTKEYVRFINEITTKITVIFTHVKAHTGIPGNELADQLAKRSVGLL
jgi:ribonuclease HI